jgi:hypothetical protein
MLAEMDSRLETLQQELKSLALPTAPSPEPERSERVPRTRTPPVRLARPADLPAATLPPPGRDESTELPAAARKRVTRQITAVADGRSAPAAAEGPPRRAPEPPSTRSIAQDSVVRQTILEADDEARRVVEDARRRIADIGARTRALLEHSPVSPHDTPEAAPRNLLRRPRTPASTAPERRRYEGAVTVHAGPFGDFVQLNEFERALSSVPGVEDVYVRTFERHHAHFELRVVEPRLLIADLQARTPDPLHVVEAGERDIRLQIGNETERTAS